MCHEPGSNRLTHLLPNPCAQPLLDMPESSSNVRPHQSCVTRGSNQHSWDLGSFFPETINSMKIFCDASSNPITCTSHTFMATITMQNG